ncbi:restriction endonuclease subunit S, partial [Salmonella enterica subsp. enterica serovar Minnesota]
MGSVKASSEWRCARKKAVNSRLDRLEREFVEAGGIFAEKNAGELFDVKSNPQLDKSSFVFTEDNENTYPYFTRTVLNNGIAGYVEYLDEDHKISGNSIAVGMLGMQFF